MIDNFARSYNCEKDSFEAFQAMLIKRQEEIFKKDFSNSARVVSLSIIRLIREDKFLQTKCMR